MPRTRTNYGIIGTTQSLTAQSSRGVYTIEDQKLAKQNGTWPSTADVVISPAVGGISNWIFAVHGNIVLTTPGEYTLTFLTNLSKVVKMWGAGGAPNSAGSTSWGQGAAGGAANGTVTFSASNTTYIFRVPQSGRNVAGSAPALAYGAGNSGGVFNIGTAGSGGGYAGIFKNNVTQTDAIMIAGGGGGGASDRSDGLGGRGGNVGGGTAGGTLGGFEAGSGTQSAGGSAAGGGSPTSGSTLQGGNGSGGGGGGGGGYYGGGGGGTQGDGGYGGGGGSGYYNPSYVTSATLYQGTSYTTAGNSGDAQRPGTAGNSTTAGGTSSNGAIVIIA